MSEEVKRRGAGYGQLQAWKSADDLAVELFRLTKSWSRDLEWLRSQVMRAAVSVPANIAEGYSGREAALYDIEYKQGVVE